MGTEFGTGIGNGEGGDAAGRAAAEQALAEMAEDDVDFAVVFCSPAYDCEAVIDGVRAVTGDTTIVGATAEGKFTEKGVHTSAFADQPGVTVALIASDEMRFFTGLGRNVSKDLDASIEAAAADLPTEVDGFPHLTGLMLSSAPLGREELAHRAYQELPIEWGGGGANDLTLENNTVFAGDEIATDAVVLTVIASTQPIALGVGNRHEPIGGSVEVTRSDGNTVFEIDGKPAYEAWKDVFAETAQERLGFHIDDIEDNKLLAFQSFSEFVFGLRTSDDRYKVRSAALTGLFEPYAEFGSNNGDQGGENFFEQLPTMGTLPEGALQFAEPLPEGAVLYPMTSGKEGTIKRGTRSVQHAMEVLDSGQVAGGLVFECPCGEATLREDYHKLIEAVADPVDAPLAGIQSGGGEVCFRHDDMRGVNHTSTTVMLFPGGEKA